MNHYNQPMRLRRLFWALLVLVVLLPLPAILAPHVSSDPMRWAYRVYHPFMYRYPALLGWEGLAISRQEPKLNQSVTIAQAMMGLFPGTSAR